MSRVGAGRHRLKEEAVLRLLADGKERATREVWAHFLAKTPRSKESLRRCLNLLWLRDRRLRRRMVATKAYWSLLG